ncbi:hypothetical protein [Limnovirga soli]|uniref:Lipoprotein n=1 Tax=Limnovirga soli TaxID=2656915 RepID=A0A8J8JVX7_9BACT|nr:hypothetical protein [Limnovirga soli]NNV54741.1 hypothetical protein [Limnovirga soli]
MNEKLKAFYSITILCFVFTSCTVRDPCDNVNIKIALVSFSDSSLDRIIIRQFDTTQFHSLLDSVIISNKYPYEKFGDTALITYSFDKKQGYTTSPTGLSSGYDYEVYIPREDTVIKLAGIEEKYKMRTAGYSNLDDSHCNNYIISYKVNEKKYTGNFEALTIYLHK